MDVYEQTTTDKLEKTNKRALRFVANDNDSSYETLCMQERQLNIHKRCIKSVAVLMFKVKSRLAPSYILDLVTNRELPYNVRDNDSFTLPNFNTITYGKKSLKYYLLLLAG